MTNRTTCKKCGAFPLIGVEVQGVWDGVLYWRCSDCESCTHRFPKGHSLREKAEPYVDKEDDAK
jgi:hypothetical protein